MAALAAHLGHCCFQLASRVLKASEVTREAAGVVVSLSLLEGLQGVRVATYSPDLIGLRMAGLAGLTSDIASA